MRIKTLRNTNDPHRQKIVRVRFPLHEECNFDVAYNSHIGRLEWRDCEFDWGLGVWSKFNLKQALGLRAGLSLSPKDRRRIKRIIVALADIF